MGNVFPRKYISHEIYFHRNGFPLARRERRQRARTVLGPGSGQQPGLDQPDPDQLGPQIAGLAYAQPAHPRAQFQAGEASRPARSAILAF